MIMYPFLLSLHSWFRWAVLVMLLLSIVISYRGFRRGLVFTAFANQIRHWTATSAHLQLMVGIILYFQSTVVKYPVTDSNGQIFNDHNFFKFIHISLMLLSVVFITFGSAKAKRMHSDVGKYRTMLIWFLLALLIIIVAIPWPFSPFAARPYSRTF